MIRRAVSAGLLLAALSAPFASAPTFAAPQVIASIKPVHSLAAAVMAGVAKPELLLRGGVSPHSYALRPSDAARLAEADIVFWIGSAMESFLARPLGTLAADAAVLEIGRIPGLTLLPSREGGVWEPYDDHEDAEEEHAAGAVDAHLWLDPGNAKAIAAAMAEALSAADPGNAPSYRANARSLEARIDALDAEIAGLLAPVGDRPFVVFHDAYQYFEAHYGLAAAGSITMSPDQPPGARRLREIRAVIIERGAACLFREPQVEPALVELVVEGTGVRQGELDPEGAGLAEGPELYFEMMRNLAHGISRCLAEGS